MSDGAGLTDDLNAELNAPEPEPPADQPDQIPDRPADGATKAKWGEYLVALGMHPDTDFADRSKEDLARLADRFGG